MNSESYNQKLVSLIRQLEQPNKEQTWDQMLDVMDMDVNRLGVGYLWMRYDSSNEVAEVVRLSPVDVWLVAGTGSLPGRAHVAIRTGYEVQVIQIPIEDMLIRKRTI